MGSGYDYRNLAKYYSEGLNLDEKGVKRLNYLRKLVGNSEINFN